MKVRSWMVVCLWICLFVAIKVDEACVAVKDATGFVAYRYRVALWYLLLIPWMLCIFGTQLVASITQWVSDGCLASGELWKDWCREGL